MANNPPSPADLANTARAFSRLPPNANPIRNRNMRARLPAHLQEHADHISASPTLAAIATGSPAPGAGTSAPAAATPTGGLSTVDAYTSIKPDQSAYHRLPNVRHQVLGAAAAVFAAAGSGPLVFKPQMPFKGNRLVIPSATLAGTTISNMLVGTKPQYAAASTEPFDLFEEQSTGGTWDLDMCEVGQSIQCTVTVTAATTVNACIVGEVHDGKSYPPLLSGLKRAAFVSAGTV